MSISYQLLYEIVTNHNYYADGVAPDLSFQPTPESLKILKDNKLRVACNPGKVAVYFQSLDGSNPLVNLGEIKLTFTIQLQNAIEFLNFTNLNTSQDYSGKKKLFFQNLPVEDTTIDHSLLDFLKGSVFTYRLPISTENPSTEEADLILRHIATNETISINEIAANQEGGFIQSIDLRKAKNGLYAFESTNTTSLTTETEQIYIDDALATAPLFGLVEITYNGDSPTQYQLNFQRKTTLWNYIVVNKSSRTDFSELLVKDNNSNNEDPYQSYQFQKQPGQVQVGASTAVVFQSDTQIPFFQRPKLEIELVKEMNGSDMVLLKNLSNPSLDQISSDPNESDIYVFV